MATRSKDVTDQCLRSLNIRVAEWHMRIMRDAQVLLLTGTRPLSKAEFCIKI